MFTKAKNMDTAFRYGRRLSITVLIASITLCCVTIYQSYRLIERAQDRIYILASGKVLEAGASQRSANIQVEAKDHVASFHTLFFSLDPDNKVIEANLSRALYLADASAKKQYDNLKESGYYSGIVSGNISQQLQIDSIRISSSQYPYRFELWAVQKIIRPTSIVSRSLVTEGQLRNVSRSDNNPHGFLIEKWKTLQNQDIQVQIR